MGQLIDPTRTTPEPVAAPTYESLTDEQKALLAAKATGEPDSSEADQRPVVTGFVALLEPNGTWTISHDLAIAADVAPVRPATAEDMYAAAALLQKDIIVQNTAAFTQQLMMQAAQAMAQQQESQRIAQGLRL